MTVVQELTTIQSIVRLAMSDLKGFQSQNRLPAEDKEILLAFLSDMDAVLDSHKLRALGYASK